ncbi:MAG: hypothetical protein M0R80_00860 [Proteobacteria bacterium]|nr:hypothetical protein [Pseudomonadota bacterium]
MMDEKMYAAGVEIDSQEVFWNVTLVPKENPGDNYDSKYAELQWGWTAGMSEEDLKNVADDAPKGYDYVRLLPDQAIDLRNQLDAWIRATKPRPLHMLTPEEKADIEAFMPDGQDLSKQIAEELSKENE